MWHSTCPARRLITHLAIIWFYFCLNFELRFTFEVNQWWAFVSRKMVVLSEVFIVVGCHVQYRQSEMRALSLIVISFTSGEHNVEVLVVLQEYKWLRGGTGWLIQKLCRHSWCSLGWIAPNPGDAKIVVSLYRGIQVHGTPLLGLWVIQEYFPSLNLAIVCPLSIMGLDWIGLKSKVVSTAWNCKHLRQSNYFPRDILGSRSIIEPLGLCCS